MKNKKISKIELIKKVTDLGTELNRKPVKRDNKSLNYYAIKLFGSWNNLMKAAGYPVRFYQKIGSFKLNADLAYFLGLLITDGHICYDSKHENYKVAIYTSYPNEKDTIIKLIKDIFDYNPGISSRMYGFNKKPNYEVRISSKNLAKIIVNEFGIPSGAKSLSVVLPEKIKEGDIKIKTAFLRGVIDGDGTISNRTIKIVSGSVRFLEDLKLLLKELNVHPGSIIKDNKGQTFSVRINKHEDLLKIKQFYDSKYYYKRKKQIIDKI